MAMGVKLVNIFNHVKCPTNNTMTDKIKIIRLDITVSPLFFIKLPITNNTANRIITNAMK
jgi:hypothetical protein